MTQSLLDSFEVRYGAFLRSGMLGQRLVADLLRGLAFDMVLEQEDAPSLQTWLASVSKSVVEAEAVINTTGGEPLKYPAPKKTLRNT